MLSFQVHRKVFSCLPKAAALAPCNCKFVQRDTLRRLNPFFLFESWNREVGSVKDAQSTQLEGWLCVDVKNTYVEVDNQELLLG